MANKRKNVMQMKNQLSTPFVIISVCGMLLFTLVFGFLVSSTMSSQFAFALPNQNVWRISFLIFILIQLGVNITLLIITLTTLHKTIGAFPRLERDLDKILAGDYAVRIGLREKDDKLVSKLATKINKVLNILENKVNQK